VCGGVEKWDGTSKGEVGEAGEGASIHDIIMKIEDKHIPTIIEGKTGFSSGY
jgi:hypothetical protein